MIFSLSDVKGEAPAFSFDQTDIFCFFHSENSVHVPSHLWLEAIAATLKQKKNALILESSFLHAPMINSSQRWHAGPEFLWLAPRSLSVLLEAPEELSGTYKRLKEHLSKFK